MFTYSETSVGEHADTSAVAIFENLKCKNHVIFAKFYPFSCSNDRYEET